MASSPGIGGAIDAADPKNLAGALVMAPLVGTAQQLNIRLAGVEPWRIVLGTASASFAVVYLYSLTQHRLSITTRIRKTFFKYVRKLPQVRERLEREKEESRKNFELEFKRTLADVPDVVVLPEHGWTYDVVQSQAEVYLNSSSMDWRGGSMSGTVYSDLNSGLEQLITHVYGLTAYTNPLHPDAFPGVRKMEAEIVRMACTMFNGGPNSAGCVTSGGTESIILACKSYRELARENGNEKPEILCPVTAHAAFDKAAEMLCMTIKHVPVDEVTKRVDLSAMKRMITRRTAVLVGSAPQFPHGSIDPIEEISALGVKYGIPVHVDACLGGFLIAFMDDAGFKLKPFDFRLPGVTSISADTHKYGFSPKGTSVILYRDISYRSYQWFTYPDWPGGIYATPTIAGSRSGGVIATCWAAMMAFGKDGYVKTTKKIVSTTKKIAKELSEIPGIQILGIPEVSVVAFGSDSFNIYGLSDGMKARGWALNSLQNPNCAHLCVTSLHTDPQVSNKFVSDVKEITEELMKDPESSETGSAAMYGACASIPDRNIAGEVVATYLDALYSTADPQATPAKTALNGGPRAG